MAITSQKQVEVLKNLRYHTSGMTPTQIGQACGKDYGSASSWANGALKVLMTNGFVVRKKRDGKVLYALTEDGTRQAKELQ